MQEAGLIANSIIHVVEEIPTDVLQIKFSLILEGQSLHYDFSAEASAS